MEEKVANVFTSNFDGPAKFAYAMWSCKTSQIESKINAATKAKASSQTPPDTLPGGTGTKVEIP